MSEEKSQEEKIRQNQVEMARSMKTQREFWKFWNKRKIGSCGNGSIFVQWKG